MKNLVLVGFWGCVFFLLVGLFLSSPPRSPSLELSQAKLAADRAMFELKTVDKTIKIVEDLDFTLARTGSLDRAGELERIRDSVKELGLEALKLVARQQPEGADQTSILERRKKLEAAAGDK